MDLRSFHLFLRLPIELRRKIYLLATPSRIVHLREDIESRRRFMGRRRFIDYKNVELHPSLSYYADEFRRILSDYEKAYSVFNANEGEMPEWEEGALNCFLRKSRFFSEAPIPVLLHTCSESREMLISAGYRLSFGSRDHDPWTWFHFENNILYLASDFEVLSSPDDDDEIEWDIYDYLITSIVKLDLDNLQRVRKVALYDTPYFPDQDVKNTWAIYVSRFLPKLDKIYYVVWDPERPDFIYDGSWARFRRNMVNSPSVTLMSSTPSTPLLPSQKFADTERNFAYRRELWKYVPIQPTDYLFAEHYPWLRVRMKWVIGSKHQHWPRLDDERTKWLQGLRDKIVAKESADTWQIPKVESVHICKERLAKGILDHRPKAWNEYVTTYRILAESGFLHDTNDTNDTKSVLEEFQEWWKIFWCRDIHQRWGTLMLSCPPNQESVMGP
ncbi:hypothetical protein F4806DRAFT_459293 [Annulohypoxylon nitens]|nr:hypothetical protein F4806DRAFT_459293 [Annulohypoxylon nitens]